MLDVALDPAILTFPGEDTQENELRRFAVTIAKWAGELGDGGMANVYVMADVGCYLGEEELRPDGRSLEKLFKERNIREYNGYTVADAIWSIISHAKSFENEFKLGNMLLDETTTRPELFSEDEPGTFFERRKEYVVLNTILANNCSEYTDTNRNYFVSKTKLDDPRISVKATYSLFEPGRSDIIGIPFPEPPPGYEYSNDVPACNLPDELLTEIDEFLLWSEARSEAELKAAIKIALYKNGDANRDVDSLDDGMLKIRLHDNFVLTAIEVTKSQGKSFPQKILQTILATVEGLTTGKPHPLRVGSGGNDTDRIRASDGASAWRRDIDRDCHLHYWKCRSDVLEFAHATTDHDDYFCPE